MFSKVAPIGLSIINITPFRRKMNVNCPVHQRKPNISKFSVICCIHVIKSTDYVRVIKGTKVVAVIKRKPSRDKDQALKTDIHSKEHKVTKE